MKLTYEYRNQLFSIDLVPSGKGYQTVIDGQAAAVEIVRAEGGELDLLIDGKLIHAHVSTDGGKRWVTVNGQTFVLGTATEARKTSEQGLQHAGKLVSNMPGVVRAVPVSEGEHVNKGQTLAIIEAMKMENKLLAPFEGQVKKVLVKVGQTVDRDEVLVEITASTERENDPDDISK